MKIQTRDIDAFLRTPTASVRAVLVYGPDKGLVTERATMLGKTVCPDLTDPFSVVTISGDQITDDPARLLDEATALSFGGGRRLVRVHNVSEKSVPAFKGFFSQIGGDSLVVVEGDDLGPKSALRKLFETEKLGAAIPCYVEEGAQLSSSLRTMLASYGLQADADCMVFLTEHLAGDRMLARMEIEKLANYMGAGLQDGHVIKVSLNDAEQATGIGGTLSLSAIAMTTADQKPQALDALLQRAFAEGMSPIAILRTLQNHFRRLHIAKSFVEDGSNPAEAMKKLNPPIFFKEERSFSAQMGRWPLNKIEKVLGWLSSAEGDCKKTGVPSETLCMQLLLKISKS